MTATRRLAAILAANVAGYSRLTGMDEEGTLESLKALRRELLDPQIAEHRGPIVKTTGDGMLVGFASVVDAVRRDNHARGGAARNCRRRRPSIGALRGYLIGDSVLFWSLASWWIPLLASLMLGRHLIRRIRLAYHFNYWSIVFPLARYAASTFGFAQVIGVEFLNAARCSFSSRQWSYGASDSWERCGASRVSIRICSSAPGQ